MLRDIKYNITRTAHNTLRISMTNIDHDQALRQRIWALIDSIEDRESRATGHKIMAHEIAWLAPLLQDYQKLKPLYFYNWLCKQWDEMNENAN